MIRARDLVTAIQAFGIKNIDRAIIVFDLDAVRAWGPEHTAALILAPMVRETHKQHRVDLGRATVRNGFTDEGRRYYKAPEGSGSYSRWEYAVASHDDSAIYSPRRTLWTLDRDAVASLYAVARCADELHFTTWFDAETSPVLAEHSMHGDTLSVMCGQAAGKRKPQWEHRIATYVGRHVYGRPGWRENSWPSIYAEMMAAQAVDA